ncbi:MAG: ATP-binding protein [Bacteroidetes bacterium]|nr:MAG: ATP-binding protein [Bacteroidota bacterium]
MQNHFQMEYSIAVSCRTHNLQKVRKFVENILNSLLISPMDSNLVLVAIDELCANLMLHSHYQTPSDLIEVKIREEEDGMFIFEVHDTAVEGFDPSIYEPSSIQDIIKNKSAGGMGLMLVKKIMDSIHFERKGQKNICRVCKTIKKPDIELS